MYACRIETINSKPYIARPKVNHATPTGAFDTIYSPTPGCTTKKYAEAKRRLNITWPATRLANNRTAKLNGLTSKTETNSIAPTRGFKATGTPGGHNKFVKYFIPSVLIPTKRNIK